MLTNSGSTITNAKIGYYYALYISASGPVSVANAEIISGPPSGQTSGVFIIKANATSITLSGASNFYNRACELEGEIVAGT